MKALSTLGMIDSFKCKVSSSQVTYTVEPKMQKKCLSCLNLPYEGKMSAVLYGRWPRQSLAGLRPMEVIYVFKTLYWLSFIFPPHSPTSFSVSPDLFPNNLVTQILIWESLFEAGHTNAKSNLRMMCWACMSELSERYPLQRKKAGGEKHNVF